MNNTLFEEEISALYEEFKSIWMYPNAKILDKFTLFSVSSSPFDWIDVISFTAFKGYKGVIKNIGYGYETGVSDFAKLNWRVLINGKTYLDYEDLQSPREIRDNISLVPGCELNILFYSEDTVTLQAKKAYQYATASYNSYIRIRGWSWITN